MVLKRLIGDAEMCKSRRCTEHPPSAAANADGRLCATAISTSIADQDRRRRQWRLSSVLRASVRSPHPGVRAALGSCCCTLRASPSARTRSWATIQTLSPSRASSGNTRLTGGTSRRRPTLGKRCVVPFPVQRERGLTFVAGGLLQLHEQDDVLSVWAPDLHERVKPSSALFQFLVAAGVAGLFASFIYVSVPAMPAVRRVSDGCGSVLNAGGADHRQSPVIPTRRPRDRARRVSSCCECAKVELCLRSLINAPTTGADRCRGRRRRRGRRGRVVAACSLGLFALGRNTVNYDTTRRGNGASQSLWTPLAAVRSRR